MTIHPRFLGKEPRLILFPPSLFPPSAPAIIAFLIIYLRMETFLNFVHSFPDEMAMGSAYKKTWL